jgi:hypothetical protein
MFTLKCNRNYKSIRDISFFIFNIRSEAFTAAEVDKIFSGYQQCLIQYRVSHMFPGNPDNKLESQYPCSHVFDIQIGSKLLSGFPGELMNYSALHCHGTRF